jgi:protein-disulfide isomerase
MAPAAPRNCPLQYVYRHSAEAAAYNKIQPKARIGINGTPGFFINGHFLSGVVSHETMLEVVDQQLNAPT